MALLQTPICDFGRPAINFSLPATDGELWTLERCRGAKGLLVMFICNHCPYVQAIRERLVRDCLALQQSGIGCVAIMPNDVEAYPEDAPERMREVATQYAYPFPYLYDATQQVAKAYGAVCTPDFFGYNARLELHYRGRLDASRNQPAAENSRRELVEAMRQIADSGQGPQQQIPSMGCSIKWKTY